MDLVIDPDVRAVAEFMQSKMPTSKLVGIADGIARIAPTLWGRYMPESVSVLMLSHPQPSASESVTSRPTATGSAPDSLGVGGDFVVAVDAGSQR
jgi:hypothetical protein